jgi:tellurite resistance protein TehA-like permease
MTPIWIFPAYPLLIIGPHAGVLAKQLRPSRAFDIIIGGFTVQGVGYMVSLMIYAAFIYRLMTQKLPTESLRPGMFVSVGPSGFTCAGILNMAASAERAFGPDFMGDGKQAAFILKIVGNWMGLWCWG